MQITEIRLALSAVIEQVPGIASVQAFPPDKIGVPPAAWLSDGTSDVQMSSLEVWNWTLPLTVVVGRKSVYAEERKLAETFIAPITAALRANYTLGGLCYGLNLVKVDEGSAIVGGVEYVGLTFRITVKQKFPMDYTG